jgi:hypothetical protein
MDEKDENVTTNEGLTQEQPELLTRFAARRAAAVAAGRAPEQSELEGRRRYEPLRRTQTATARWSRRITNSGGTPRSSKKPYAP